MFKVIVLKGNKALTEAIMLAFDALRKKRDAEALGYTVHLYRVS
jgi:hypothetical protein